MAYCRQCGALIDEAAQFCPDCGASQAGAQTTRVVNQDVEDNRFCPISARSRSSPTLPQSSPPLPSTMPCAG